MPDLRGPERGVVDACEECFALLAIATIVIIALMDPDQWVSLSIAAGIVASGFVYYNAYLRKRTDASVLLLSDVEDVRHPVLDSAS